MAKNALIDKIVKASTTKRAAVISEQKFLNEKDVIPTDIISLNIAYSGDIEGGLVPGFTMIAGPSKHFKSLLMLLSMKAYLDKYDDAIAYLYDSEFGTPLTYFEAVGIDPERVVHNPITNVEELKHDAAQVLEAIERGDKIFIGIDSIGNLASKKEVEDAIDGKSVADMSRAKQLKSLFRIITPHLTIKDIPLVAVNHTYKEIGLFPKDIVGGGTGSYYSADTIWIIGRQQQKDGTEIVGYNFVIRVEKSRFVKEGSKIPITVNFDAGVEYYSGLVDMALESGHLVKPKNGWYAKANEEKNYRAKDLGPVLDEILQDDTFKEWVINRYKVGQTDLVNKSEATETEVDLTNEKE